jgi:FkbM family methyltransferase
VDGFFNFINPMLDKFLNGLHSLKKKYAGQIDFAEWIFLSSFRKFVIKLSRKKIVEDVNGFTMHVDDNDSLALSWHRVFEPGTTEYFKNNIKPGQTIVDIGANIGYYTLLFSKLTGPHGHVYAFEPEPENIFLLKKNLEINSIKNVTVIEKAVDVCESSTKLFINKKNRGNHRIFDSGDHRKSINIQTTSIDKFFENINVPIDWIKMDIEGAEYRALQGMKNFLQKNNHLVLVTEIFPEGLKQAGSALEEVFSFLQSHNFQFEEIVERKNVLIKKSKDELIREFNLRKNFPSNIICKR